MRKWLPIVLIVAPALEMWIIIEVGSRIGGWLTFALLVAGGFLGAWLIRREGMKVWRQVGDELRAGRMPGNALLDGVCVLAGGIMLIAPGFVTDLVGITLLLPATRALYRLALYRVLLRRASGSIVTMRKGPRR